ncbi:MAG: hypothetical protein OHK0039_33530 [Bacteroidia bacterium]
MKNTQPVSLPACLRALLLLMLAALPFASHATHNLAGQITAERNDPNNPNSYRITLTTYTDPAPAGVDRCSATFLLWSFNGSSPSPLAEIINVPRRNGPPMTNLGDCTVPNPRNGVVVKGTVKRNIYDTVFVFPGPGIYEIYYFDVARHGSVVNMNNPDEQAFFVGTRLFIPPSIIGFNNTPVLLNEPLDDACVGKRWEHNPGGIDPDGDSLVYSLVPSYNYDPTMSALPQVANGYRFPDNIVFGNSTFSIDSRTGLVSWDVPQQLGIYNFGLRIDEYRNGTLLGYVIRDIAVWVIDCDNEPPVIESITDTCIYAGETLVFPYRAYDPDKGDSLYLDLNNGALGDNGPFSVPNRATVEGVIVDPVLGTTSPYIGLPISTLNNSVEPVDTIKGEVTWATVCDNIRKQFYQVDFVATDNKRYALPNTRNTTLTDHHIVTIRVVPPPPLDLRVRKGSRIITLDWMPPICDERVVSYRLYRRVSSGGYMADTVCCEVSPIDAGFDLVASLDASTLNFVDSLKNISGALGNNICYVITAMYDDPVLPGVPVLESCGVDTCIEVQNDPIYLTHASVTATDAASGELFVAWSQPSIDSIFPAPYQYRLYRANNNGFPAIPLATLAYDDTTYNDSGLDTEVRGYNYRVEIFDALGLYVNTSDSTHIGSSIYLTVLGGGNNYIDLSWVEFVPWRNLTYEVYRSAAGGAFALIATVGGTGANLHSYRDSLLNPAVRYCYFVRGYGAYGIPDVEDPLINDSQVACDFAQDDEPPCYPSLTAVGDCDQLTHSVRITKPTLGCDGDAAFVTLYFATNAAGPYLPLFDLPYPSFGTDTLIAFTFERNDPRYAGCYAVTATDTLGNTSELSPAACVDYCPALVMGNVFSPNGDGVNDVFRPVVWRDVALVECIIYDRWGRVIATTRSNFDQLWDGTQSRSGKSAPAGVYYYALRYEELGLSGNIPQEVTGFVTLLR